MSTAIRLATPEDAAAIVALYAPYVQNTSVTFEYEVPSVAEYRARIEEITRFFPFYILEEDGVPAGYAYAHFFHPRKAYQWVCETTIYVGEGFHRKGCDGPQAKAKEGSTSRAQGSAPDTHGQGERSCGRMGTRTGERRRWHGQCSRLATIGVGLIVHAEA